MVEELFRQEWSRMVNFLMGKGLAREAAEDVAQEAFLALWRRKQREPDYPVEKTLYATIRNKRIDHWRSNRYQALCLPLEEALLGCDRDPAEIVLEAMEITERKQRVDSLTQPYRDVIERRALGENYAEISLALQIPIGTVKSRLNYARRAI